jgi:hypothetical protein
MIQGYTLHRELLFFIGNVDGTVHSNTYFSGTTKGTKQRRNVKKQALTILQKDKASNLF